MLKLYKKVGDQVHYWEAWSAGWQPKRGLVLIVHWGVVGQTGQMKRPRLKEGQLPDDAIEAASQPFRKKGYAELGRDEHFQVIVQYRTEGWGSEEDLKKRHKIEGIFNECLGWTGNGRCDGGDIGSGTINVFSIVVDPLKARDAMVEALKKHQLLEGAVIAVRNKNEAKDYTILWPQGFEGEFSIM